MGEDRSKTEHPQGGRCFWHSLPPDEPVQKSNSLSGHEAASTAKPPRVVLAEDDNEMRALLASALCKGGYDIAVCSDGLELMETLDSLLEKPGDIDLVISDIWMPGVSGLEVLQSIHRLGASAPVILITAFGREEIHAKAYGLGAAAVFDKPFEIDDLLAAVRAIAPPRSPA